jgi:hypothetical protein
MRKTVVLAVDGRQPAPEIVATLREAGVTAEAEIRETHVGHVARAILDAADEHDARFLVLGSSGPRPSRPCRRPSRANPAQASPPPPGDAKPPPLARGWPTETGMTWGDMSWRLGLCN